MAKPDPPRPDPLRALAADIYARLVAAGATGGRTAEAVAQKALADARAFLRAWDEAQEPNRS